MYSTISLASTSSSGGAIRTLKVSSCREMAGFSSISIWLALSALKILVLAVRGAKIRVSARDEIGGGKFAKDQKEGIGDETKYLIELKRSTFLPKYMA